MTTASAGGQPSATASPDHVVDVPVLLEVVRLPVVRAEQAVGDPVLEHQGERGPRGSAPPSPGRIMIHIPRRRFSSASSYVVHSWSLRTPAARYAFSAGPESPGA